MRSHPYFLWIPRLLQRLGVSEADIERGRINPDWLLIPPEGKELAPEDTKALYKDVSDWLLTGFHEENPHTFVRHKLQKLVGIDTLPLVYAMRLVAADRANSNRYWPPFIELLLSNRVDQTQFVNMASLFTEQWMKLYHYSRNRLYYPREGKVNIKWPISHAGLLPEDKRLVEQFGCDLKSESEGQFHPSLNIDADDFQAELLQWLYWTGHGASGLVARISHKERGLTVSALSQHVLRQRWELLKPPEQMMRAERRRSLRQFFQYDIASHRIELVFQDLAWPGLIQSLDVSLGDEQKNWPVIHDHGSGTSRGAGQLAFTIRTPAWPNTASLSIHGNDVQTVRLLECPFETGNRGALLFEAKDGQRTRSWHPEQSYYLLASSDLANQPWIGSLFEDVQELGTPAGNWNGYSIFWVRSRSLFQHAVSIEQLEELNSSLQQADAALSLPGLSELLRPRLRPVYGLPLPAEGKEPVFATTFPPGFEVRGLWAEPVVCFLERWNDTTATFDRLSVTSVPPPVDPPVVVLPFTETPAEGRYRIQLQDTMLTFVMRRQIRHAVPAHRVNLTLRLDGEDAGLIHPSRNLALGRLTLQAWPGACVSLCVDAGSKQVFPMTLDDTGTSEFCLPDFVANLDKAKTVLCHVTCGAIRSDVHRFIKSPSAVCTATLNGLSLRVEGSVVSPEAVREARIWIVEDDAWLGAKGAVRSEVIPVDKAGRFRADISAISPRARWVLLTDPALGEAPPWHAELIHKPAQPAKPWKFGVLEEPWDQWGKLADWLARFHIAAKDLRRAVLFSRAVRLSHTARVLPSQVASSIRAIAPSLVKELPALLSTAAPPRLLLVPTRLELPKRLPADLNGHKLSDYPGLHLASDTARAILTRSVPEDGIIVSLENAGPRINARLYQAGNGELSLVPSGAVRICGNCGSLLTSANPAARHTNNALLGERCNTFLPADSKVMMSLAIVWNPRELLESLAALVDDLFAGRNCEYVTEELSEWINDMPFQPGTSADDFRRVCQLCASVIELAALPVAGGNDDRLDRFSRTFDTHQMVVDYIIRNFVRWAT